MFRCTVRHGSRRGSWKTRAKGRLVSSWPSSGTRISPPAGGVRPAITRSSVDLPTPDEPTTQVKECSGKAAENPESTGGALP